MHHTEQKQINIVHLNLKLLALLSNIRPVSCTLVQNDSASYHNCAQPMFVSILLNSCWAFCLAVIGMKWIQNMKFNEIKRGHAVHDFNSCLIIWYNRKEKIKYKTHFRLSSIISVKWCRQHTFQNSIF